MSNRRKRYRVGEDYSLSARNRGSRQWRKFRQWRFEQQKAMCNRWLEARGLTEGFPVLPLDFVLTGVWTVEHERQFQEALNKIRLH